MSSASMAKNCEVNEDSQVVTTLTAASWTTNLSGICTRWYETRLQLADVMAKVKKSVVARLVMCVVVLIML